MLYFVYYLTMSLLNLQAGCQTQKAICVVKIAVLGLLFQNIKYLWNKIFHPENPVLCKTQNFFVWPNIKAIYFT